MRRFALAFSVLLGSLFASPARAEPTVVVTEAAKAAAKDHFERAKGLYLAGNYREAIRELEEARGLDPSAKDLVFNLALVHEKLGALDPALEFLRTYLSMDITAEERHRAELAVRRLEGAKGQVKSQPPIAEALPPETRPLPQPTAVPKRGRVDALTVGTGTIAILGFATGTVFGLRALAVRPDAGTTTSEISGHRYEDLSKQAQDAHRNAVVADISFAVGALATVGCAALYFGRTKNARLKEELPHAMALPARDGLAVVFVGPF